MIENRNLIFMYSNDNSADADKFLQLPKIANASLPSATAIDSQGENEGGIAYDTTNNEVVVSDGSSWTSTVSGANDTLSNLGTVAVNTDIVSDADSTDDLGASSEYWANIYVDKIYLHANTTITGSNGVATLVGDLTLGEDDTGYDLKCFGATSGKYMIWDESADQLQLTNSTEIVLGGTPGSEDGLSMQFNGTASILFDALTANDAIDIGSATNTDVHFHGGSADADTEWDASANELKVKAGAKLVVVGDSSGDGTEGLEIPYHATATPSGSPGTGSIFFEVDADKLHVYDGSSWVSTTLS